MDKQWFDEEVGAEYIMTDEEFIVRDDVGEIRFAVRKGYAYRHKCQKGGMPVRLDVGGPYGKRGGLMVCYYCLSAWPEDDGKMYFWEERSEHKARPRFRAKLEGRSS